jgi:hypothetical protein
MKMKKLFITLTISAFGVIMIQSCDDIEPQVNLIHLDVEHISRSGIDTSTTNIDTLTTNIDTTSTTK